MIGWPCGSDGLIFFAKFRIVTTRPRMVSFWRELLCYCQAREYSGRKIEPTVSHVLSDCGNQLEEIRVSHLRLVSVLAPEKLSGEGWFKR